MEFEFDKEIDAILRKARESEFEFSENPNSPHLDADEISAFAANALPEKAKMSYTAHLADCARCRKILSNLILLESKAETFAASSDAEAEIGTAQTPWYRRVFAMPNLAYAMGALALLFSGLIAFIVLQSSFQSVSEVSQIGEKADTENFGSAPATSSANMAVNTNAVSNSASVFESNTATTANAANVFPSNPAANASSGETKTLAKTAPENDPSRDENKISTTAEKQIENLPTMGRSVKEENKLAEENQARSDDNEVIRKQEAPKPNVAQPSMSAEADSTSDKKKAASKTAEATKVGGKTFRRSNNVWYDTAYKGQSTTNITRGSDEYKKLDSDLQRIAENLAGIIVIVWKEKAYRIQ